MSISPLRKYLKWRLSDEEEDSEKAHDQVRLVLQNRENNYGDYKAVIDEVVNGRNTKPLMLRVEKYSKHMIISRKG